MESTREMAVTRESDVQRQLRQILVCQEQVRRMTQSATQCVLIDAEVLQTSKCVRQGRRRGADGARCLSKTHAIVRHEREVFLDSLNQLIRVVLSQSHDWQPVSPRAESRAQTRRR